MRNSRKIISITILVLISRFTFIAQESNSVIKLTVIGKLLNGELKLDSIYSFQNKKKIKFTQLRFYIGQLTLKKSNKIVFKEENVYHLIDFENRLSTSFFLRNPESNDFDEMEFYFGIDSITNTNGIGEGELDPVKGMYWTWQSGYINAKIEGSIQIENLIDEKFEYHIGGFLPPFNACRKINLSQIKNSDISLVFDLTNFFELYDFSSLSILSPGKKAVEFSEKLSNCFKLDSNEK